MFHRLTFHAFGREISLLARVARSRPVLHYGIGNRCTDARYLLMLDYDDSPEDWVRAEIALLQEDKRVGNAHLFKTKNGYHVIFLEKLLLSEVIHFLGMTTVDQRYRDVPLAYGLKVWVLRESHKSSEKIVSRGTILSPHLCKTPRSNAHMIWLRERYGLPELERYGGPYDQSTVLLAGWYKIAREND